MFSFSAFNVKYIDYNLKDLTLRFRLRGRKAAFVSRQTFFTCVEAAGITDILGVWKGEDPYECFISVASQDSADTLKDKSKIKVNDEVDAYITDADDVIEEVKFLWVPLYISNELFEEFLTCNRLQVLSSDTLKDGVDGKPNGTRVVRVLGNKKRLLSLPHLIDFTSYGFQSLIKIPGREPLCLKCKGYGHLRFACEKGRRPVDRNHPGASIIDPSRSTWGRPRSTPLTTLPEQDDDKITCSDSEDETLRGTDTTASQLETVINPSNLSVGINSQINGVDRELISQESVTDSERSDSSREMNSQESESGTDITDRVMDTRSVASKDKVNKRNFENNSENGDKDFPSSTNPSNLDDKRSKKKIDKGGSTSRSKVKSSTSSSKVK